jgi:hypothetical protein
MMSHIRPIDHVGAPTVSGAADIGREGRECRELWM